MCQELLLEFFSEEIPARFQKKAISDSKKIFAKILKDYGAKFSDIETYVSPRRIAVRVLSLEEKTQDMSEEKRGPKVSAPANAIKGFLRSNNKVKTDLIEKGGYYYLNIETKGQSISEIINDVIEDFIAQMPWQKSMRWYVEEEKSLSAFWVRPLRDIHKISRDNYRKLHVWAQVFSSRKDNRDEFQRLYGQVGGKPRHCRLFQEA